MDGKIKIGMFKMEKCICFSNRAGILKLSLSVQCPSKSSLISGERKREWETEFLSYLRKSVLSFGRCNGQKTVRVT